MKWQWIFSLQLPESPREKRSRVPSWSFTIWHCSGCWRLLSDFLWNCNVTPDWMPRLKVKKGRKSEVGKRGAFHFCRKLLHFFEIYIIHPSIFIRLVSITLWTVFDLRGTLHSWIWITTYNITVQWLSEIQIMFHFFSYGKVFVTTFVPFCRWRANIAVLF